MASVNELNITSFVATGQNTPIARYTFTLEVKWTDDAGVLRTHGPQTYTYPNDLGSMPLAVRKAFAVQMIAATARVTLGIDEWSQYE